MKFEEFKKQLNNEITSAQPEVYCKVKATPVVKQKPDRSLALTLTWVKAKKFVVPVAYAICAIFIFILSFSTITADNVGVSDLTYMNVFIDDDYEKSVDFDIAINSNNEICKINLDNSENIDESKKSYITSTVIGMPVDDAIKNICDSITLVNATIKIGTLNDSSAVAKTVLNSVCDVLASVYTNNSVSLNVLTSGLTKDLIVSKAKSVIKTATKLMSTDELIAIVFNKA
ncbi:MAG: hypothetical protein ACI4MT_03350 [Christensenellales bacterium]